MDQNRFKNRKDAGERLATLLEPYVGARTIVYALPRGGVIIGDEIAKSLHVPLDIINPRKIVHPDNPEYAVAAVNEKGEITFNPKDVSYEGEGWFNLAWERAHQEAKKRREIYARGKEKISARGKTAIIADDGAATGLTILSAIREIRKEIPWKIIVALPVMPSDLEDILSHEADQFVAVISDPHFRGSVGMYYDDFSEVEDVDVLKILDSYKQN